MSQKGSALRDVLQWSTDRPVWQRDALRRLYQSGSLSRDDEEELYAIARSARGFGDVTSGAGTGTPLADEHLPAPAAPGSTVSLKAFHDVQHVNALAPGQSLVFGKSGLTVIYGDNATGKSGYARILRQVCRTRGGDRRVLPNVFDHEQSGPPTAKIVFCVGGREEEVVWRQGDPAAEALTQMSFFDSQCAAALVATENELAYAPVAVELLRQLAGTCRRLKGRANEELAVLRQAKSAAITDPPVRTEGAVQRALSSLRSSTRIESIEQLASLSEAEEKRIDELRAVLADRPEQLAKAARLDRERLERLQSFGQDLGQGLAEERFAEHRGLIREAKEAREAAQLAATKAFGDEPLEGVGSLTWRRLWEAAREYSNREAYPETEFPNSNEEARCVLCQQELREDARERMNRFEEFVQAQLETAAQKAERSLSQSDARWEELRLDWTAVRQLVDGTRLVDEGLAEALRRYFVVARWRLRSVFRACRAGPSADWDEVGQIPPFPDDRLGAQIETLARRERELTAAARSDERQTLQRELEDLTDRQWLAKELPAVRDEINRLRKVERMEKLIRDLDSAGVTRKSTEISEQVVTEQLATAFDTELDRLSVRTARVRVGRARGHYGAPHYQIELDEPASNRVKAAEILSEGEHRAIALAGFLAELETSGDRSALIFDDPVSSLDHKWRRAVSQRLAEEAERRQVVVFTHDPVFLLMLQDAVDDHDGEVKHWRLVRRGPTTGVPVEEPPNLKVTRRIADLNNRLQAAGALRRQEGDAAYESEASAIYYRLRKAWERAVEEVLLGGVVERLSDEIHTKQLRHISDITKEDIRIVERSMTKCSRFAHDEATAINDPIPDPEEIQSDIDTLKEWRKAIMDRRN